MKILVLRYRYDTEMCIKFWFKFNDNLLVCNRTVVVVVVVVTLFIHGKFISSVNYKILMIINTILKTKTILIYTNKTLLYMNAVCYKR